MWYSIFTLKVLRNLLDWFQDSYNNIVKQPEFVYTNAALLGIFFQVNWPKHMLWTTSSSGYMPTIFHPCNCMINVSIFICIRSYPHLLLHQRSGPSGPIRWLHISESWRKDNIVFRCRVQSGSTISLPRSNMFFNCNAEGVRWDYEGCPLDVIDWQPHASVLLLLLLHHLSLRPNHTLIFREQVG